MQRGSKWLWFEETFGAHSSVVGVEGETRANVMRALTVSLERRHKLVTDTLIISILRFISRGEYLPRQACLRDEISSPRNFHIRIHGPRDASDPRASRSRSRNTRPTGQRASATLYRWRELSLTCALCESKPNRAASPESNIPINALARRPRPAASRPNHCAAEEPLSVPRALRDGTCPCAIISLQAPQGWRKQRCHMEEAT